VYPRAYKKAWEGRSTRAIREIKEGVAKKSGGEGIGAEKTSVTPQGEAVGAWRGGLFSGLKKMRRG